MLFAWFDKLGWAVIIIIIKNHNGEKVCYELNKGENSYKIVREKD